MLGHCEGEKGWRGQVQGTKGQNQKSSWAAHQRHTQGQKRAPKETGAGVTGPGGQCTWQKSERVTRMQEGLRRAHRAA